MLSYALCSKLAEYILTYKVWFDGSSITSDLLNRKGFPNQDSMTFLSFSSLGIVPGRIPLKSTCVSLEEALCGPGYFIIYRGGKT